MTLEEWAARWALPDQAVAELQQITYDYADADSSKSEAAVASECRLELNMRGVITMRNNVGVLNDKNGRPVRFGLCNETPGMNKIIKSSDDICIIPYVVKPQDVGRKLGVFLGVEHKERCWSFTGEGRETPQATFHRMLANVGAVGVFANSAKSVIDTLVSQGLICD